MGANPHIPYGQSDFRKIRLRRWLYVDKTRFIRQLEPHHFAVLLRPRRFGKSLWVSILENYYERSRSDGFQTVFAGTDIGRNPTEEQGRHVVLRFNFSAFDDRLEAISVRFDEYCKLQIRHALARNGDLVPKDVAARIVSRDSVSGCLNELWAEAEERNLSLCVLVDEYDNFANNVMAHHGGDSYRVFTRGGGFYRSFFTTLKAGTESGALDRLFITGVSPITLDDVTSGFNIGEDLSLDSEFNELLGFTADEVSALLRQYRASGGLDQDVDQAMTIIRAWYGGYRFTKAADRSLFNPDMVLYYLKQSVPNKPVPEDLIDQNVRMDYGKLRHLLVVGRALNGNFDLLRDVASKSQVRASVVPRFPLEHLSRRENFLSLLHFLGLLTIRNTAPGAAIMGIPNHTVRRLLHGQLRDGFRDGGVFSVDLVHLERLLWGMAEDGAWRPVLELLTERIERQTSVRDYIAGESMLKGFLAAYFGLSDQLLVRTEAEFGKGYVDIAMLPDLARFSQLSFGYLIELKYIKRGEATRGRVRSVKSEAVEQLRRYLADPVLSRQYPGVKFTGIALVFHGWEIAVCDDVQPGVTPPPT